MKGFRNYFFLLFVVAVGAVQSSPDCPDISPLEFGNHTCTDGYRVGTKCTARCQQGYRLAEPCYMETNECVDVGDGDVMWMSSPAICVRVCEPLPFVYGTIMVDENDHVIDPQDGFLLEEALVTYRCAERLESNNEWTRMCVDGEIDVSGINCIPDIGCKNPEVIECGGLSPIRITYKDGEAITYSCNDNCFEISNKSSVEVKCESGNLPLPDIECYISEYNFRLTREKGSFAEALKFCESDGGQLAHKSLRKRIYDESFKEAIENVRKRRSVWMGLSDIGSGWQLLNFENATDLVFEWGDDQPDDVYGVENCGVLTGDLRNGTLADASCENGPAFYGLCEIQV